MSSILFGTTNGNYSDDTKWVGGVKPTAADDALLSSLSANLTIDTTSLACRSLDCNTFIGTLTLAAVASVLSIGDGSPGANNIALRFVPGMTFTSGNGTVGFNLISTSATQQSVYTAGKTIGNFTFNGVGGSWLLGDGLIVGPFATLKLSAGTLNTNSQTLSIGKLQSDSGVTRVLTLGSSQITLTLTSGTVWQLASSALTLSAASSIINIGVTSSSTRTFAGAGGTYGILNYILSGSTGELDITGSNTFQKINFYDASNARSLKFTAGTTTTILGEFNVRGSSGKLITIDSITAAAHNLSKSSGVVACDYLNLKNSHAAGGATWYAGSHSVDLGGNTGWIFTDPPAGLLGSHVFGDEGLVS